MKSSGLCKGLAVAWLSMPALFGCSAAAPDEHVAARSEALCSLGTIEVTPLAPGPVDPGETVSLAVTANCAGGEQPLFRLRFRAKGAATWTNAGPWTSGGLSWDTEGLAGGMYELRVQTRARGSTVVDLSSTLDYALGSVCTDATLTTDAASPTMIGASPTFTSQATCPGGSAQYQFLIRRPGETFDMAQDWSSDNTFVWDTEPEAEGTYRVQVRVRAAGNSSPYDVKRTRERDLVLGSCDTLAQGQGSAFSNEQPWLAIRYLIATSSFDSTEVGQLTMSAANVIPKGWLAAEGQFLEIASYAQLFSALGFTYGGDGLTFALPDLRGRIPVELGAGVGLTPRSAGDLGGVETSTLSVSKLPAHTHTLPGGGSTASSGGAGAFDNMQPWLALTYGMRTDSVGSLGGFAARVSPFASTTLPATHAPLDGASHDVAEDLALFGLIGTTYGTDDISTFFFPDLRGRTPVGSGQGVGLSPRDLGAQWGTETTLLSVAQLPPHSHTTELGGATNSTGQGFAVDQAQPSMALRYLILMGGQYPSPGSLSPQEDFLGEIAITAATSETPGQWQPASGQILSIAQNTALFSLLGTTFGGNGATTFALPDLRGRAALQEGSGPGLSQRIAGERTDIETTNLTTTQLASHKHAVSGSVAGAYCQ